MSDGITDLSVLHDVPWSNIEGAHVEVKQATTDHALPEAERRKRTTTEIREGVIVGRGEGRGVTYDTGEREVVEISIGPSIYLDTPEDTILEVRTYKDENELLDFTPAEETL
jgi:hypothetical protein